MRPRNFPMRRALRQARARARAAGEHRPTGQPHVTDIKVRMGATKRAELTTRRAR